MIDRYAVARDLARRAGALALDFWRRRAELVVELKGPGDFVSLADREVEALIRRDLARAFDVSRVSDAFGTVDSAQQALDRNASPKIVADWVA